MFANFMMKIAANWAPGSLGQFFEHVDLREVLLSPAYSCGRNQQHEEMFSSSLQAKKCNKNPNSDGAFWSPSDRLA